jgi:arylsulfatase A-like enzyme
LRRHREDVISLYDAGIRWVDAQVARLAKVLQALGAWQNCVVAVSADHGEEFLDHGGRYHPPSSVAEELIRVPLLLRAPGLIAPAVETAPFSLLHLAPTLLDLVGVPMPDSFRGRSYVPSLRSNPGWGSDAIVECIARCNNPLVSQNRLLPRLLVVRESRYKMVLNFETAEEQLFDLEADKLERRPLANTAGKPVRKRLLDRAQQHLSDSLSVRDPDRRLAARLHDLRFQASRFELSVSNSAGILPA